MAARGSETRALTHASTTSVGGTVYTKQPIEREGGTLESLGGIHVVQLRGNYEQMGRQHSLLAGEVCGDLIPSYLNGLIEKLVAHAVPAAATPLGALLKRLFLYRNRDRMGDEIRALLGGSSEAFGLPGKIAERVLLVPDIVHYLAGRSFVPLAVPPMCTGMYARDSATQDGRQLIARNFDFFGRGSWNSCNALIVMHPKEGQRICWISALGAPVGPQGFNEAGLFFALHTKFTRDVSTTGVPLFTLCHKVMSRATTLDEAIRLITAEPRLCGLSMFLVDSRARQAAAVGFSARHHEVVHAVDDVLVRANHYITEPMQRLEIAPHPWQRNSRGRFNRMHEMIATHRGTLTAAELPAFLSDCHDIWESRLRVTGNILACVNTTQSMVCSPDEDTLWLAHGDHPVAHAGVYHGFRMSALLSGDRANYAAAPLAGGCSLDAAQRAALQEYAEAWSEYFDNLNSEQAAYHLRRAAAMQPEEAIFPRMIGLLLLKQRKYHQALPYLMRAAGFDFRDALARAESQMWVARCLDLMGRRTEAMDQYRLVAALDVPPISPAARRHLRTPFKTLDLLDVAPEFICGTAIAKYKA